MKSNIEEKRYLVLFILNLIAFGLLMYGVLADQNIKFLIINATMYLYTEIKLTEYNILDSFNQSNRDNE